MFRSLPVIVLLLLSGHGSRGQTEPPITRYDMTRLDTNFTIHAWGTEPPWSIAFKGSQATGHYLNGVDSSMTFTLFDRIENQGFTNEYVDTYRFVNVSGEQITLMLVREEEGSCTYDMGEGEADTSAYLLTHFGNKPWMLLGCARIDERP
ncbi:MAG: hypothetical protein KDB88_13915 [Flavobacteriales bacterium]|nr:hypothetical protein [Flavobacteriales bacterium]